MFFVYDTTYRGIQHSNVFTMRPFATATFFGLFRSGRRLRSRATDDDTCRCRSNDDDDDDDGDDDDERCGDDEIADRARPRAARDGGGGGGDDDDDEDEDEDEDDGDPETFCRRRAARRGVRSALDRGRCVATARGVRCGVRGEREEERAGAGDDAYAVVHRGRAHRVGRDAHDGGRRVVARARERQSWVEFVFEGCYWFTRWIDDGDSHRRGVVYGERLRDDERVVEGGGGRVGARAVVGVVVRREFCRFGVHGVVGVYGVDGGGAGDDGSGDWDRHGQGILAV